MNPVANAVARLLRGYHAGPSRILPSACRFYPSCSVYAAEAISTYGLLKGGYLAARRLARCQPFSAGGIDWVPGTEPRSGSNGEVA